MPSEGSSRSPLGDLTNHSAKRAAQNNSCQPTVAKKLKTAQSCVAGSLYAASLHTPWGTEGAEPDSEDDNAGIDYPYDAFSESDSQRDERPNYYEREFLDWPSSDDEGKRDYELYDSDDKARSDCSSSSDSSSGKSSSRGKNSGKSSSSGDSSVAGKQAERGKGGGTIDFVWQDQDLYADDQSLEDAVDWVALLSDHQPIELQTTMQPQAAKRHAGKRHAAAQAAALACHSGPKDIKHLLSLEESLKAAQQVCNRLQVREDVKATVNSKDFLQKFVKSATVHGKLCCSTIANQSCRVKAIGLQDGRSMAEEGGGGVYKGTFFDEDGEPTHRYTGMTTNFARRYREHVVACLYSPSVHYNAAQEAEHCSYRALAIVSKGQYNNSEYAHLLGCLEFIWTIRVVLTGHKTTAARASALNPSLSPHFAALVDAESDRLRASSPAELELVKGRMLVAKVAYCHAVAALLLAGQYKLRLCYSKEHNSIQASNLYSLVVPAHLRRILLKKLSELQDSGVTVAKLKLLLPSAQKASPTDFFAGSSLHQAHLFAGIHLQLLLPKLGLQCLQEGTTNLHEEMQAECIHKISEL
ncbi:hypothetical protein IE81DRAFT_329166 [Ceraceosorus guamensis]|uniref:Uncharacterized protein n=1 Tax=Ceraceosorus guamensis TaxID=1522189 RepID=A0A316W279_9BASI|nr:hypothetical protein IE81DRAFT_329166 [Ceraceosorus guamensis]PWN43997.1 hypothetical protein IE81DRAFT_329166 [Ceraceosorus guamensis]